MKNVIFQQDLLEKIISSSKEVFNKKLALNSDDFSYDDEKLDRKLSISTEKFKGCIHRYEEKRPYYAIRFNVFFMDTGFDGYLEIHNAFGKSSFYIDDGDYGRVDNYDVEKLTNTFSIIYNSLTKLIN